MTATKPPGAARYPIRAVAKLTGLSIDTLRAWERRYRAVVPTRGERGRLYTDRDVDRLRLLRDAVAHGHAIGHAVTLSERDLRQVAATPEPPAAGAETAAPTSTPGIDAIMLAVEQFDGPAIEAALGRLAALLDARSLWREVLAPLLTEIGERWEDGHAGVAHEHLLSASVRNVLGTLMRANIRHDATTCIVFATPSGERHELGTLGAAMVAAAGGLRAVYLGPDLPASDLVALARSIDADVVVLGLTARDDDSKAENTIRSVAQALSRDVELWVGGPGAAAAIARSDARILVLSDFDEFEQHLGRIGARF
jgi:DNA-binding transcriptional MerR regulator/methylmalonyl-CoA mutase cobalamin-binding subunit